MEICDAWLMDLLDRIGYYDALYEINREAITVAAEPPEEQQGIMAWVWTKGIVEGYGDKDAV